MRLSFHIGMGKTGTSAIQEALGQAQTALNEHGVHYLGRWWDFVDPALGGTNGMDAAAALPDADQQALADRLVEHMRESAATRRVGHFIFSNEALYAHTRAYEAFYLRLMEQVDLDFVVFAREPVSWLLSAHAQWAIRHKSNIGPVEPLVDWARKKIGIYGGLRYWHERFPEQLVARKLEAGQDAVAELMKALGLDISIPSGVVYPTPEPALLLLQASHGELTENVTLPHAFARQVYGEDDVTAPAPLPDQITRLLDPTPLQAVVAERRDLFDGIRDEMGLDLLDTSAGRPAAPGAEAVRHRLLDCLVDITLRQARRIDELERRLSALEGNPDGRR